ncbi:unnamed protein product [Didymodactylos carnosus]|uniref:Lysophospholipid acyltransferase 7 n=1 Tax=Didymodactylos carnosus TaxID=1234261 RepID=A0A813RMB4_9BILA|nr:unnamed protein product [Didymodactylos carnosus]CAF0786312.1 unnamed protein product [Didymodactylos carnosus]CAF3511795.1 unnamed protein product [Didymodactylos carnosus]CAF3570089.1 unnamed protein product [Didymodactylos carnosus]
MKAGSHINALWFIKKRGIFGSIYILTYLLLSTLVSFKDATHDSFYDNPLWYRLVYMSLIFTLFRCRFYSAWLLAESMCITSSFGAYPLKSKPKPGQGPTDLMALKQAYELAPNNIEYDFETVHNIDDYMCETALTVREVLRYWNMTVQYWMATYVYRRIKWKKFGQPITMGVSAFWHGIHGGYYLSMLTTTPCIMTENVMEAAVRRRLQNRTYIRIYDFFSWVFRTRQFDYMSMGFILLRFDLTIRYWKSVYFIGHIACLVLYSVGMILLRLRPKSKHTKVQQDMGIGQQPKASSEQHGRLLKEENKTF